MKEKKGREGRGAVGEEKLRQPRGKNNGVRAVDRKWFGVQVLG